MLLNNLILNMQKHSTILKILEFKYSRILNYMNILICSL